jgi:hypothetical protein
LNKKEINFLKPEIMKKYLILLFFTFTVGTVFSQDMSFSVFAEPQITWLSPDSKDVENAGSAFGFNGGLNYDQFFKEKYAISTGISINKISGRLLFNENNSLQSIDSTYTIGKGEEVKYNLQYLNIPLGFKFKTVEIGYTQFYAHLGLEGGINIKADADLPDTKDVNISKEIKWYHLSYYIGGGIEYSIGGNTALVGGLTYKNGFLDMTKKKNNKITSGLVSLRLGIVF